MTWTLRARTPSLGLGAVLNDWSGQLIERHNLPDTLQVTARTDDVRDVLDLAGGVTLDDGSSIRFTGPISFIGRTGQGVATLQFESDLIRLWERIAYPTPSAAITAQTVDYGDVRTGPAETVLLGYVNANAGPGALAARRVPGLTVPVSAGRGGTITVTARLDNLGRLVSDIAEAAGLRVRIQQSGATLQTLVTAAVDLSATARFGTSAAGGPGLLADDWSYEMSKPDVTCAIVAGGGEGTARVFRERIDTTAQTAWGRRIETLEDQRHTLVPAELDKAGDDALADGAQPIQVRATVLDSPQLRLGVDVPVGSKVTVDLDGDLIVDRLRQVTTTISATRGQPTTSITGIVGSVSAELTRSQRDFLAMRKTLRKVAAQ